MSELNVPGVSVAVAIDGRLAWARGFGVKEAGLIDPVTPKTLFQAASISKPIAATAILELVEQGRVDLDAPVNDYLTSWRLPDNSFTADSPVTLRRLISHGAGTSVWGFAGYEPGMEVPTVPQILDGVPPANSAPVRVELTPGRTWWYSGGGVTVAQLALMDVTGNSFAEVLDELVLGPFGMDDSTFAQPLSPERRADAAAGHISGEVIPGRWRIYPELAAAGLWTTPSDLVTWAIEIAAAYRGDRNAQLSQEIAREMLTPQQGDTGLGPSLGGRGSGYFFGHSGANAGFTAQLIYFPETGQGAAVMSNGDRGGQLNREILLAIAAEYDWPDYAEVESFAQDSASLVGYLGTFVSEPLPISLTLWQEDDLLYVDGVGALGHQEVVFTAPDRAVTLVTGTDLEFRRTVRGDIDALESLGLLFERQD